MSALRPLWDYTQEAGLSPPLGNIPPSRLPAP